MIRSFFIGFLCFFLTACLPEKNTLHGYVEGEFVMLSPTTGGLLGKLNVERGQSVSVNQPLFSLDLTELKARQNSAKADLLHTQAELADLLKGERPEELAVILKQKEQAEATLTDTKTDYERELLLVKIGGTSQSAVSDAKAAYANAKGHLDELDAQLKAANLAARVDRIESAKAIVEGAKQILNQADKKLLEAAPKAPLAGVINDTFYRPGEYVAAGQPVVSLLPPANIQVRFFVPQKILPHLKIGEKILVSCDGCKTQMPASITYIASQSEYTPPVIYSVESREKLVFLIEAKPDSYQVELRPGLPVDIHLMENKP